jgi:crotonobetainyl-CoA:carnitine CoA-transferase CaiB-like acyl-CoA transferase
VTAKGLASLGTEPLGTEPPGTGQAGTEPPGTGPAGGALAGLRVVDFGQYLAGPPAGMLLADQGADGVGQAAHPGPAVRMSVTPVRVGRPGPLPGADRASVLAQLGRPS